MTAITSDVVVVSFPARSEFVRISRMNATTLGSDLGMDVDVLDDLRLAVAEMVTWLVGDDTVGGRVELEFQASTTLLEVRGVRIGSDGDAPPESDDLRDAILGATVDRHELTVDADGVRRATIVKSVRPE